MLGIFLAVVTSGGFFLPRVGEAADAAQVADDACAVVDVLTATVLTVLPRLGVDVAAGVADGASCVGCPVRHAVLSTQLKDFLRLCKGEELLKVEVERTTAVKVLGDVLPVHLDLVKDAEVIVLYAVEVGVVAVTLCGVARLSVPLGILDTEVFGGDKFGVEAVAVHLQRFFVLCLEDGEHFGKEFLVVIVVVDGVAAMLCRLDDTVQSDGEELFTDVHVARCVGGEQSCGDVVLVNHTMRDEVLVDALDELFQSIRTGGIT